MLSEDELIRTCIDNNQTQKIVSLPLQFANLPVDILSKQFTKLNNPHSHRIHYLGPRYTNTQTLHKKCTYFENAPLCKGVPDRKINKYKLDVKRIANSFFINERLRTNHFYKTGLYYRAFEGMNPSLNTQQQFIFNGSFESANLDCVIKYKSDQFDLFLRIDSNTRGHLQWFYFSIQNGKKMQKIRLNLCNISKPGTFYQQLMQPYMFSQKAFELKGREWTQGDPRISNISFTQKPYNYKIVSQKCPAIPYCYSFQYQFQFEDDEVFFAYCIPYTYSQLLSDIQKLPKQLVKMYRLGQSLTGLQIPLLHITNHSHSDHEKRNVLITGRIHPGQSNGSHVLKGFINHLCSVQKQPLQVLKHTNFYIIPMINPDGVVLGNSRCSASGRDLNRMFNSLDKQLFPEIQLLKTFTKKFMSYKPILMYFDFHGHSKKKNTFFYGPVYPLSNYNYLKCRVLPRIIQKINCSFRYYSCRFSISQSKKSTGRATMFETFQIPYTYTVESSIGYYYDSSDLKTYSFSKEAYEKIGRDICEGTSIFIIALDQYDCFLRQRRLERQRKRNKSFLSRRNDSKNYNPQQDQVLQNLKPNTLKIFYRQKQPTGSQCLFIKLLQQIKTLPEPTCNPTDPSQKNEDGQLDKEASSDDHDQKQDFQNTKLKQFNNLIIQNARKDHLFQKIGELENNQFVRSGNFTNQFNHNNTNRNNNNWNDDQQNQLFQQLNVRTTKSKSSQGNRKYRIFEQKRFFTKNMKKRQMKKQHSFQNQISQPNQNQFTNGGSNHIMMGLGENGNWQQGKDYQIQMFFDQKYSCNNNIFEKKQFRNRNSTLGKSSNLKLKKDRTPHFSQMHFPDQQKIQQKRILKHQKTDLLRKNIERRRQRQDKLKLQNLNCSELTIIKHQKVDLNQPHLHTNPLLNTNQNPSPDPRTKKKFTQFKMDDLLTNLQFRSKMLTDSVKYKQTNKKIKIKSNFMFPSSFYGVKQHSSKKRSSSYSRESGNGSNLQEPFSLTVKNFYK